MNAKEKYNTKPIDFTGCHPVIAEHLKRGEAIECRVWDIKKCESRVGVVVGFSASHGRPYRCDNRGISLYRHAEPIPIKTRRIMPPERAIPVLIKEGWRFNHIGQMDGPAQTILRTIFHAMFCRMGTPLDDPNTKPWSWPPCIIEEVEDDE